MAGSPGTEAKYQEWTKVRLIEELVALQHLVEGLERSGAGRGDAQAPPREGEQRYRTILNAVPALISYVDADRIYRFANQTYERWFGIPADEIPGRHVREVLGDEGYASVREAIDTALSGQESRFEVDFAQTLQGPRAIEGRAIPDIAEDGSVRGYFVLTTDVTERKRMEEALSAAQARLSDAIESLSAGFALYDADERLVLCNARYRDFWPDIAELMVPGVAVEDLARAAAERGLRADAVGRADEWLRWRLERFRAAEGSYEQQLTDGRWTEAIDRRTSEGGTVCIRRDITERKEAEEALRESEQRFRGISEASPVPLLIGRRSDGTILYANSKVGPALGLPADQVVGRLFAEFYGDPSKREGLLAGLDEPGSVIEDELEMRKADGTPFFTIRTAQAITYQGEQAVIGGFHDITERKRIEEALRTTSETLEAFIKAAPLAISVLDLEGRVLTWNPAAEAIFGWREEEVLGKPFPIVPGEDDARFREDMRLLYGGQTIQGKELRRQSKDGRMVDVNLSAAPVRDASGDIVAFLGLFEDITSLKRAQDGLRESEERFKDFTEAATDWAWETDARHRLTFFSGQRRGVFGADAEENLLGRTRWEILGVDPDRDALWRGHRDDLDARRPFRDFEFSFTDREDGTQHRSISGKPVFDADGAFVGYRGTTTDVTDQKRAEQALREREERIRGITEYIADGIVTIDQRGVIESINPAAGGMFGYTAEEAVGRDVNMLMPEPDRGRHDGYLRNYLNTGESKILGVGPREVLARRKDGSTFPMELTVGEMVLGERRMFIGAMRDISERKRVDAALQESEEQFRRSFEDTGVGMVMLELDGRFRAVNRAFRDMLGYTEAELLDRTFADVTYGDDLEIGHEVLREMIAGERQTVNFEKRYVHKEGHIVWVSLSGTLIRDAQGAPLHSVAHIQDISERRRAEDALRESEAGLANAQRIAKLGSWEWDPNTGEAEWSDQEFRIYGLQPGEIEPSFDAINEVVHPDDRDALMESVRRAVENEKAGEYVNEYRIIRPDGAQRVVHSQAEIIRDEAGKALRLLGTAQDITERKQLEEQLLHAQKMDAVGQLTGGVAHDFNNLLAVILGNLELVSEEFEGNGQVLDRVSRAVEAANRGATLTQRLLAFSRKQILQPVTVDLNKLTSGLAEVLRRTLGETVEVEVVTAGGLWKCFADPAQLETVLLNLALNARDAMPMGGKLTIETANARLDDDYAIAHVDVAPGQYVLLALTDTGTGMSSEVVERAFEPFFTTKEIGRGTGLGLSMIYGFVKQSGGHVKIYSEVGQGTTVKIYLPRLFGAEDAAAAESEEALPPRGAHETILVVEDDAKVRETAVAMLRSLDYVTLEAVDGVNALAVLDEAQDIALLFTDVVLPGGMSGADLAREVERRRPGLPVLYTSGYTDNAIVHHSRLDEGAELLVKPFRKMALARKVRAILDRDRERES